MLQLRQEIGYQGLSSIIVRVLQQEIELIGDNVVLQLEFHSQGAQKDKGKGIIRLWTFKKTRSILQERSIHACEEISSVITVKLCKG